MGGFGAAQEAQYMEGLIRQPDCICKRSKDACERGRSGSKLLSDCRLTILHDREMKLMLRDKGAGEGHERTDCQKQQYCDRKLSY